MSLKLSQVPLLVAALGVAAGAPLGAAVAQPPRLLAPSANAAEPFSFADLVQKVQPAVVSVFVERKVDQRQVQLQQLPFFQFRFGGQGGPDFGAPDNDDQGDDTAEAQGSGFFIDAAGHVVTNNHVVEQAKSIEVRLNDGTTKKAKLIGADPLTDLAVLQVEPDKNQTYVEFANDVNLRVGDWVLAVGNPFGLAGSVTSGIVSAIGRPGEGAFADFIQIDAPINRGNSGGPTFDLKGRVVGVNTAIFSPNGGSVGIGFAIPAKVAKDTVDQLVRTGSIKRGYIGAVVQPVTHEVAAALGRKEAAGALVADVTPGAPAANAGIRSGDVILQVNNHKITDSTDLTRTISGFPPGAKAQVRLLRGGQEKTLVLTLAERLPSVDGLDSKSSPRANQPDVSTELGVKLQDLSPAFRQQLNLDQSVVGAVVTDVKRNSPAADAGLQRGAVILEIDGKPTTTASIAAKLFSDARKSGKEAVLVRYQLGDQKLFGALSFEKK